MFAHVKKTTQIVLITNPLGATYIFLLINGSRVRVPDGVQKEENTVNQSFSIEKTGIFLFFFVLSARLYW